MMSCQIAPGHRPSPYLAIASALLALVTLSACSHDQTARSESLAVLETVAWSPDGKQIAAGRDIFNIVFLYDAVTLRRSAVFMGQEKDTWGRIRARSLAFSHDGGFLAAAGIDRMVVIWDARSGDEVLRLNDLRDSNAVAFSPVANVLAASGPGSAVTLWKVPEGSKLATLAQPAPALSVAFSPNGDLLVTGGEDHVVRVWRTSDGETAARLQPLAYPVTSVAFSPDGETLAAYAGKVTFWEQLERSSEWRPPRSDIEVIHSPGARFGAFLLDLEMLSAGKGFIPIPSGAGFEQRQAEHAVEHRMPIVFSSDGRFLAVMRENLDFGGAREILLLQRDTGRILSMNCNCYSMAFSPDGKSLVTVGFKVRLWNPATGQELTQQ